jgi:hypothetical protein
MITNQKASSTKVKMPIRDFGKNRLTDPPIKLRI